MLYPSELRGRPIGKVTPMCGAGKEDLVGVKLALALDVHSRFLLEAEIRVHSVFPNCECDGLDAALPKASRADRLSPSHFAKRRQAWRAA